MQGKCTHSTGPASLGQRGPQAPQEQRLTQVRSALNAEWLALSGSTAAHPPGQGGGAAVLVASVLMATQAGEETNWSVSSGAVRVSQTSLLRPLLERFLLSGHSWQCPAHLEFCAIPWLRVSGRPWMSLALCPYKVPARAGNALSYPVSRAHLSQTALGSGSGAVIHCTAPGKCLNLCVWFLNSTK